MSELVVPLVLAAALLLGPTHARIGTTRHRQQPTEPVDPALVLDLLATAVESGADLPRALTTVGAAIDGDGGEALRRVAAALLLGAEWSVAWNAAPPSVSPARDVLAPAWITGVSAAPGLRSAATERRQQRRHRARRASARLAVRLVLPLGLCFLPSFVLIGVTPVVIALAGELGW